MKVAWSLWTLSSLKETAEVYGAPSSPQSRWSDRLCCLGGPSMRMGSCRRGPAGWSSSPSSSFGSPGGQHPRSCRARVWFRCRSPCLRRRTPLQTPSPGHCKPGSSFWSAGWDATAGRSAGQSSSRLGSSALRTHLHTQAHPQISCRQEAICQTNIPHKEEKQTSTMEAGISWHWSLYQLQMTHLTKYSMCLNNLHYHIYSSH